MYTGKSTDVTNDVLIQCEKANPKFWNRPKITRTLVSYSATSLTRCAGQRCSMDTTPKTPSLPKVPNCPPALHHSLNYLLLQKDIKPQKRRGGGGNTSRPHSAQVLIPISVQHSRPRGISETRPLRSVGHPSPRHTCPHEA